MSISPDLPFPDLDPGPDGPSGEPAAGAAVLPAPSSGTGNTSAFAGERIVQDYIDQGYELYLIAGIGGVGKTQLLDAYFKDKPVLPPIHGRKNDNMRVMPTGPRSFVCYPVKVGTRKAVFVDASGEDFRALYPLLRPSRTLPEADSKLLKVVANSLRGLILVVDLERFWAENASGDEDPGDREQVRIAAWILQLLRWFRFDGEYNAESPTPFQDQVNRSVQRMSAGQRLPFPVQIIFSKADKLGKVELPPRAQSIWSQGGSNTRTIHPPGEAPLLLAYHHLPLLYDALREHVRIFRFDFAHTLVLAKDSEAIRDATPCGVEYSMSWLLERRWAPEFGTGTWVWMQRWLDRLTFFRRARWRRLPEPRELPHG